jgi:N-acetyl-anhydromuramyl-L-alanine amidase AmpD
MEIIQKHSPNFHIGRNGKKIIAIVDHITAGAFPGCLSWLCNPKAQASSHYLVTKKGVIYQLVLDENTAWHAGVVHDCKWLLYDGSNPNYCTIGIEHEALAGEALTEAQYQATLWLHRQLVEKYKIPIDGLHIVKHSAINAGHICPGAGFPWNRLFSDLEGDGYVADVKIVVGDKLMKGVLLKDGLSYAPVRALGEALGCKVGWDDVTKTVTLTKGV